MKGQWYKPRPESSPSVPKRDDEITKPIAFPSPELKAEVYAHKTDAEVKMAFATCQDLRRQLRTALEERDAYQARCGELAQEILKLKQR